MAAAEKYQKLVERLVHKTDAHELDWKEKETAEPDSFQVSFANYSIILSELYPRGGDTPDYIVSILNSEGTLIEPFSDVFMLNATGGDYYSILSGLYRDARRKALGVDNALDEILNELDGA
jgi:hypothetical protein